MIRETLHALLWAKRHTLAQLPVPEHAFFKRLIEPKDVCIDVGAHAGSWVVPIARWVPEGQVYAFEALPYYADVLKKTVRLLRLKNVTVVNNAVTAGPCSVKLVWKDGRGDRLTGLTHIAGAGESENGTVEVAGVALDDFFHGCRLRSAVRLLKCDVEGGEYGVLLGAKRLLEVNRPVVFLELVESFLNRYGHSVADVFRFMKERNYEAFAFVNPAKLKRVSSEKDYREHDLLWAPKGQYSELLNT
jgi:FkbM family methyltransferase